MRKDSNRLHYNWVIIYKSFTVDTRPVKRSTIRLSRLGVWYGNGSTLKSLRIWFSVLINKLLRPTILSLRTDVGTQSPPTGMIHCKFVSEPSIEPKSICHTFLSLYSTLLVVSISLFPSHLNFMCLVLSLSCNTLLRPVVLVCPTNPTHDLR